MRIISLACYIIILAGATATGAALYLFHHPWIDLSVLNQRSTHLPTILLDESGEEWARFQLEHHSPLSLKDIPPHLIQAFIATEDRTFYEHVGISWYGIARSIANNLYYRRFAQGGSTITQQLIRLLFLDTKKTLRRKIKEQFLTLLVEYQYSKDQILEAYLNNIYFGCGIYGVAAAAHRFWNKKASELTPDESAILAGIVKSPRTYCPLLEPENALKRRNVVLNCMFTVGYITAEQQDEYTILPLQLVDKSTTQCIAPHARDAIQSFIEDRYGRHALYTGGLIIKTTINRTAQIAANTAFHQQLTSLRNTVHPKIDGAAVTIKTETGAIAALIGGYNYAASQFNRATHARRQIGSIFKPIVYATALELGLRLTDQELDEPFIFNDHGRLWEPANVTKRFDGPMTRAHALMRSNNIVSIKTILKIQPASVITYARACGITTPLHPYPSLALGCIDLTAVEAAGMFNTLINRGTYIEPYLIEWIKDRHGKKMWHIQQHATPVFSWETSSMIIEVLKGTFKRLGSYPDMPVFKGHACGKTGTTNDARNCWFVGATSSYTTAIYLGSDDNRPLPKAYAVRTAFPLWLHMNNLIPQDAGPFKMAPSLVPVTINSITGEQLHPQSADPNALHLLLPSDQVHA